MQCEDSYMRQELERLRSRDWDRCPRCGSTDTAKTSPPDFRYSNRGTYGCRCRNCGHQFENVDRCTGCGRICEYPDTELAERDILLRLWEGNPPVRAATRSNDKRIDLTVDVKLQIEPCKP